MPFLHTIQIRKMFFFRQKRTSGFSLTETVIAIAIFSSAILAYFSMFSQHTGLAREIRDFSVLMPLAEGIVHNCIVKIHEGKKTRKFISYSEKNITEDVETNFPNPLYSGLKDFRVFGTVSNSTLGVNGGYDISVRIEWTMDEKEKSFSLFTFEPDRT